MTVLVTGFWLLVTLPACAMSKKPQAYPVHPPTFPVELKVDFGPAGKPAYDEKFFLVEKGTTPKEAVSQVFAIRTGMVCCSLRDVMEIDGVTVDPARRIWWICLLNGSKNVSPKSYKLKKGDIVEWRYAQD